MNIEAIADKIQKETDEQIEVKRLRKEYEADEHFSGYFQEFMREFPERVKGLDADDFESLLAAIVYDFDHWKTDLDYELQCGDDYAHGDVGRDVIRKRIFG